MDGGTNVMRLILFLTLLAAVFVAPQADAQQSAGDQPEFKWRTVFMRNTSASAVAQENNWAKGSYGNVIGFTDSVVFRRAVTTLTVYDTTEAIPTTSLAFPPHLRVKGGTTAVTDTNTSIPWAVLRVSQDTTSYNYASASALDSVHVGAQWSPDGIRWFAVSGTPTRNPSAAFFTSGGDGIAPLGVKAAELTGAASDLVQIPLNCIPAVYEAQPDGPFIIHRTLCMAPGFIRFIIGMDGTGQFYTELGYWQP